MDWLSNNTEVVLAVLGLLVLAALVLSFVAYSEFKKARRMYRVFMTGTEIKNLESGVLDLAQDIRRLEQDRDTQGKQLRDLERRLSYATQRVGMVRFDAFNDAGGQLSFALALLDAEGNGVVMSSIYGRAEARVYAKPVVRGKSTYNLSTEEAKAVDQAVQQRS